MELDQGSSTAMAAAHNVHNVRRGGHVHVVPPKVLLAVYGALLLLTFITVKVTDFELGMFNVWVALFVALAKASFVALYFMHLRWDSPFNAICLIAALFFVCIFIGIAVLDSREYHQNYTRPGGGQILTIQQGH
ncbi:MAG TPA: cytochrome C oxidase subunit IV family protein [Tepidisphaeraceae bacterium]|jgi:cytochrome c oxidase subunit 4